MRLAEIGRQSGRVAAVKTTAGWEPLVAFYPRSVLNDVRAALSEGKLAPRHLLAHWQATAVEPLDPSELTNINTHTDLRTALAKETK
jgi:molybdopterin-guanine dinucleotide biosynthesis protein A